MGLLSSKKSSSNTSTQVDAKVGVSGDENFVAPITAMGDNSTFTLTDHGSVAGGLRLAMAGVEGAYTAAREARASTDGMLSGVLGIVSDQQAKHSDTLEKIKTRDVRVLILGGLAVVALVGISAFAKARGG
jgi:hypothetical protein